MVKVYRFNMQILTKIAPVSVTLEETKVLHKSWVDLVVPEGCDTGLPANTSLGLEFTSDKPEVVAVIAAFLNANLKNLIVRVKSD